MRVLFIHQNFPGQFVHLAPALASDFSNQVVFLTLNNTPPANWKGVKIVKYVLNRVTTKTLKPDFAEAFNFRGISLHMLGRLEQALNDFDKATELKPGFAEAFNKQGVTLEKLGKFKQALIKP